MNNDNVDYLPLWKKDATAEERLLELAMVARKHPERFSKFFLVYQEDDGERSLERFMNYNASTTECLGLLELAKRAVLRSVE